MAELLLLQPTPQLRFSIRAWEHWHSVQLFKLTKHITTSVNSASSHHNAEVLVDPDQQVFWIRLQTIHNYRLDGSFVTPHSCPTQATAMRPTLDRHHVTRDDTLGAMTNNNKHMWPQSYRKVTVALRFRNLWKNLQHKRTLSGKQRCKANWKETIEYLSIYTNAGSAQTNHHKSKQPQLQFNFSENHT